MNRKTTASFTRPCYVTEFKTVPTAPTKYTRTACAPTAKTVNLNFNYFSHLWNLLLYFIHIFLFYSCWCVVDFTRCGDESAQCIKISDKCDGVNDCVNEWDESISTCVDPSVESFFVSEGMGKIHCIVQWVERGIGLYF